MAFLAPVVAAVGAASAGTLATVGAGISVAGSALSTMQGMRQESYNAAVAMRNAQTSRDNSVLEKENALKENEAGQVEGMEWGTSAAEQIGQLIAARSASNTLMLGSNEQRVAGARKLAGRDQLRIRQEGYGRFRDRMTASRDLEAQAGQYEAEADAARSRRRQALFSGILNIGSSVVGGAQSIQQARA